MVAEVHSPKSVMGPYGPITLESLPKPGERVRWTKRRKAELLAAIRGGLITGTEAHERYGCSWEEVLTWATRLEEHGLQGLRSTYSQEYSQSGRKETAS